MPSRHRTPAEWVVVGAACASSVLVALVVLAGWLNLFGYWPWP
jgi:hypothetical protein